MIEEKTELEHRATPGVSGHEGESLDALHSLWNGSLTGKREQQIYTPELLLAPIRQVWPEGIAFDPCDGPDSIVGAANVAGPGCELANGLEVEWGERTYCNPPYADLKAWLAHAEKFNEVMVLGPVRTHRPWFRRAAFESCDAVAWLPTIKFLGYKQSFPAPLCLLYWGDRRRKFIGAFERIGASITTVDQPRRAA